MRRLLVAGGLLLVGCPGSPGDSDTDPIPTGEDRVADILALTPSPGAGQGAFTSNCTSCHPADGSQGVGPAMSVAVPQLTDTEIVEVVLEGAMGMPTFDHLDDQAIANVLGFLRDTWD